MSMSDFIARAKVIARAAVTWLTFASVVLTLVAGQVGELMPGEAGQSVVKYILIAVAWIGAATTIIRRVTPVEEKSERGILP